jgi:DNA-binding YbaB/EbfC family protein
MNLGDLFKQAKDVQAKAEQMQSLIAAIEVEGVSGGGLVRVTLNGKSGLVALSLDPTILKPEDRQVVEDLVMAAHADAKVKLERRVAEEMQKIAGSLGLPAGFGLT